MTIMDYLEIVSLDKYQPGYTDRELKWFKHYFKAHNADYQFEKLCEIDQNRFWRFITLQMQGQGPVPIDVEYLTTKGMDNKKRSILLTIQMLHKAELVCITSVQETEMLCTLDKIRLDKKRKDKECVFDEKLFEEFWEIYPVYKTRKSGKERCKKWFIEQKISAADVAKMIATLENQKPVWAKDGNKWISKVLTWLNDGDWRDGVEVVGPARTKQGCCVPDCDNESSTVISGQGYCDAHPASEWRHK